MTSSIRSGASAALLSLALLLGGGGRPVLAAAPKNLAAAKAAVAAAQKAYELGQFEEAIAGYTRGYELSELPALLFNLAQCHRQLKQYERAAFFYRRYLALQPQPIDNEAVARGLLEEMDQAAATQQAAADAVPAREAGGPPEGEAAPAQALPLPPAPLPVEPAPAAAEEGSGLARQWWLWTLVGAVVVGGAVTAGVLASQPGETPAPTTLGDIRF